jgi:SAM-dependent methyltransferase
LSACAVCGEARLDLHLRVAPPGDAGLAADTTAYGRAPGDIYRCPRCGHMQVDPLPAEELLESEYADVAEGSYLDEEAGQRATARIALERIEREVEPGALCDLGCWVGFLLSEAERRGWSGVGVEPSRFAAQTARDRFGLDVRQGSIAAVDLPQAGFDAVVLGDVIEHLPDPGAELDRVRGLLRRGGVLYLALPDAGSRIARRLGARWWSVLPTHVHYFTRASLRRLLQSHGFEVRWMGTAPKAFSVAYYLGRLEGYSPPLARGAIAAARAAGLADRLITPDFRDRMGVVARVT